MSSGPTYFWKPLYIFYRKKKKEYSPLQSEKNIIFNTKIIDAATE